MKWAVPFGLLGAMGEAWTPCDSFLRGWLDLDMHPVGAVVSVDRKSEGIIAVIVRLRHIPAEGGIVGGFSRSFS